MTKKFFCLDQSSWEKEFLNSPGWNHAKEKIAKFKNRSNNFPFERLRKEILNACFNCLQKGDQNHIKQHAPEDFRNTTLENSLQKIMEFNREYPELSESALLFALKKLKHEGIRFDVQSEDGVLLRQIMETLFSNYKIGISESFRNRKNFSEYKSHLIGGLCIPFLMPDGKAYRLPNDIKKCSLFFHLVYIFRHFTAEKYCLGWEGSPMPSFGKPCYDIVASISTEVLNEDPPITKQIVEQQINRLVKNKVKIFNFPKE